MKTKMKKRLAIAVLLMLAVGAAAQTYNAGGAREDIRRNPFLAGSNYTSYDNAYPSFDHTMTPAPEGYTPYYISTYVRHGSRWLISPKDYTRPILYLEMADREGRLTKQGKQLLSELHELLRLSPNDKLGVLTDVGFEQHNGIANRMCDRFPEVFDKKARVHARSSHVPRCVKSMAEEVEVIERRARIMVIQESGRPEWQEALAHTSLQPEIREAQEPRKQLIKEFDKQYIHPERFIKTLMTKEKSKGGKNKKAKTLPSEETEVSSEAERDFMWWVFELATNMQSHHFDIDLLKYFTNDELYDLWKNKNIGWYLKDGPAPQTGSIAQWRQKWILEDILHAADTLVDDRKFHGATLRFGHESCLMPLVSLMEVGTLNAAVENLDTLDHVWRNYEIYPMAGNIQLVFYRSDKDEEILVKALLNEREMPLPGTPVTGPYYRWSEIRTYWKQKLDEH